jgi:CHAT domain-containing protein
MAIDRRQFILKAAALTSPLFGRTPGGRGRDSSSRPRASPVVVEYHADGPNAGIAMTQGERSRTVPVNATEIKSLLEQYLPLMCRLSTGSERRELNELACKLYIHLWRPVDFFASAGSSIFIHSAGAFSGLPFESLRDNGVFVGQRFKVRYLAGSPSTASMSTPPPLAPGPGFIYAPINRRGLGVSRLDSACAEARQIPALFTRVQWTIRTGQLANKAEFFRDVREPFSVLHIATHGMTDPGSGATGLVFRKPPSEIPTERSGIELLSPAEVRETRLRGRLVVLAACDSGFDPTRAMKNMENIGDAFLAAGVVEVIAARWKIDDLATLAFMKSFYQSLGRGRDTASALRSARAGMIHSPYLPFQHPHFWSPLVSLTSTIFS